MTTLLSELKRKSLHLSSLWIPSALLLLGKPITLGLVAFSMVFCLTAEWFIRLPNPISKLMYSYITPILRPDELAGKKLSGSTYFILASLICVALAPVKLAAAAIAVLVISDTLAAIVGMSVGRIVLVNKKTLEGTASFTVSAFLVSALVTGADSGTLLLCCALASCTSTVLELYATVLKVDDNFLIPIGFILSYQAAFAVLIGSVG